MTALKQKVEKGLIKLQEKRDQILTELNEVADVQRQDVKQRTWLMNKADELKELDRLITQHQNRLEGMERRRQTAFNAESRKRDTKLKILLGAWVLHEVDNGKLSKAQIKQSVTSFITRNTDSNLVNEWLNQD